MYKGLGFFRDDDIVRQPIENAGNGRTKRPIVARPRGNLDASQTSGKVARHRLVPIGIE